MKEKFVLVYEGNEYNYIINNLNKNTNYEIRICSLYKDIISEYTKIYKIKTKNFEIDSNILIEVEKGDEYLKKLYEWTGYKKMELIYRGTRDGSESKTFHNKCDNQGPTIILCKMKKIIYLEDMLLYLGHLIKVINLQMVVFYLH